MRLQSAVSVERVDAPAFDDFKIPTVSCCNALVVDCPCSLLLGRLGCSNSSFCPFVIGHHQTKEYLLLVPHSLLQAAASLAAVAS